MKAKYVRISLAGHGTYIQPVSELANAIDGELDGLEVGDSATLTFEPVDMTDEEYQRLPEFAGH